MGTFTRFSTLDFNGWHSFHGEVIKEKTLRIAENALQQGRSVVVDNTHVDADARKPYINLAKKYNVLVRAITMTTSHDHARHNNVYRELMDPSHTRIKEPLFNSYRSRHVAPSTSEGIDDIIKANFVPKFKSEEEKTLYFMHLLEK